MRLPCDTLPALKTDVLSSAKIGRVHDMAASSTDVD
jgi:hypothetical protein